MTNAEDASGSGQGYLYQFLVALNYALKKSRINDNLLINIENYDDITFLDGTNPVELIQTKHRSTPKNLTNSSVDFWNTLGIWIDRYAIHGQSLIFILASNSSVGQTSAFEKLKNNVHRNVPSATTDLVKIANESSSQSTKLDREKFLSLDPKIRHEIIERIFIIDNQVGIGEIRSELENEFLITVMPKHRKLVIERLIAWWLEIVIKMLQDSKKVLPLRVIASKLQDICYEYHNENLPIEFISEEPAQNLDWNSRVFVTQIRLITDNNERMKDAIRDYYRASQQRSKWAREELLIDDELDKYEKKLIEEWRRMKNMILDENPGESEEIKKRCGVLLYNWAEFKANFPIRKYVEEPYVSRGSFHILSEDRRIGWHPDFIQKLQELLGEL